MKKLLLITIVALFANVANAQWVPVNTGLTDSVINTLAVNGTNIFAGTYNNGVFLSTNNGSSWSAVNSGITATDINSIAISGTNIFAGTWWGGGIFLSTNNGNNWTSVNSGLLDTLIISILINGANIFAATNGGVFLSTNNGTSWSVVNTGLPTAHLVHSFATNGTDIFAATNYGVFLSSNNGTSWSSVNTGLTNTIVRSLAISGTSIFAGMYNGVGGNGGVFLSNNNGSSWSSQSIGLPMNTAISAFTFNGTEIFAATNYGVFESTNNGSSWVDINSGLITTYGATSLATDGTYIYVGTNGVGVWRRPLSELTEVNEISKDTTLTISPNPFTTQTTISFSEEQKNTTIYIRDILGKQIKTQTFSRKELIIEKGELSNGIYFLQVIDENKMSINKKIVIQ